MNIPDCLCGSNPGKVLDDIAEYLNKAIADISLVDSHSDKLSDSKVPSRLKKIGLLAIAVSAAEQEWIDTVIPECSKHYDQVFPCRHYDGTNSDCQPCTLYRRLHSNVQHTIDALSLAIKELSSV